jgi:hypothetical protein
MLARALRERWPIKPAHRQLVINSMVAALLDPSLRVREKTNVIKAIIAADKVNNDRARTEIYAQRLGQGDEARERAIAVGVTLQTWLTETHELAALEAAETEAANTEEDRGEEGPNVVAFQPPATPDP